MLNVQQGRLKPNQWAGFPDLPHYNQFFLHAYIVIIHDQAAEQITEITVCHNYQIASLAV